MQTAPFVMTGDCASEDVRLNHAQALTWLIGHTREQQGSFTHLIEKIDAVQQSINRVSGLQDKVTEVAVKLDGLKADMGQQSTRANEQAERLTEVRMQIQDNMGKVQTLSSDIDELHKKIREHDESHEKAEEKAENKVARWTDRIAQPAVAIIVAGVMSLLFLGGIVTIRTELSKLRGIEQQEKGLPTRQGGTQ